MSAKPRVGPGYLTLFASLYALQGVAIAYFFNFTQRYMTIAGLDTATVGRVQSLALIPLIVRFLGGPLSDRFNLFGLGHRRPFILIGLALQGAGFWGLSLVNPAESVWGFTALATVAVLGLALYDTANDGMILDTIPAELRSRTQGIFIASRFLGAMASSIGFGLWLDSTGNGPGHGDGPLRMCAALGLIPMALTLLVPERPGRDQTEVFRWEALGALVRPRSLVLLAFGTVYATVAYGVELNLSPYYTALSFDDAHVGRFGAARYVGRAAGALGLGLLAPRLGRRMVVAIGVVGLAIAVASQSLIVGYGGGVLGDARTMALALLFGLANGWDDALFYVLAMEASDPRMAASTCALFMSVTNLSVLGGGLFAGIKASLGRYPPAFLAAGAAMLVALLMVPVLGRGPATAKPEWNDVD